MGDAFETLAFETLAPPPPPQDSSSYSPPPPPDDSGSKSFLEEDYSSPNQGADALGMAPPPSNHKHKHKNHHQSHGWSGASFLSGVLLGGLLILAVVVLYILCVRRKKKQQYDSDGKVLPIQAANKSQLGPINANQMPPVDHFGKVNPPPGGGWVAPPPPPMAQPGGGYFTPPPPPLAQSGSSDHNAPSSGQYPSQASSLFGTNCQFTYEELAVATHKFSKDNLLGQGSAGLVHKGVLSDGRDVVIKTLKAGSGQSNRDFLAEVNTMNRVHHRHLVPLIGCCIDGDKRLLVYEFIPNKTLEFHLHGKDAPVMDWATRMRIAMGTSKGLSYLHEDCNPQIIHRNIKAGNILLDNKFEPMVSDFGLAKLTTDNYTHVSTRIMGTFGYLAPEYAASGKLTERSDVYSYGIILLELITGRRAIDPKNKAMDDSLVDWARPILSKALETSDYSMLVDPRLEDSYTSEDMARMVASAAAAIRHSARRRPRMSQIVRALDGASSLDDLNEDVKSDQSSKAKKTDQSPAYNPVVYDTCQFNADMMKYK